MLLPPDDATEFLVAYKGLLQRVAGGSLTSGMAHATARRTFYASAKLRAAPPTADPALRAALATAVYGRFVIARHMARSTEMVGPGDRVFRVRGITDELREMVPPWVVAETAVMHYAGYWICDGLLVPVQVPLSSKIRKNLLAKIRAA